jgi:hypothetical protein
VWLGRHETRALVLAIACVIVTVAGSGQLSFPKKQEEPVEALPRVLPETPVRPPTALVPNAPGLAPVLKASPRPAMMEMAPGGGALREAAPPGGSSPSARASVGGLSLPLTHQEALSADGLPSSGLRCTFDGTHFRCGSCQTDSDCPAGKGCVANRETRRFECMEEECETDIHCFPGYACRPVTAGNTGPVVRRCAPTGPRREGETCDTLYVSREGACDEGLVCHRGMCSPPCRPGDAASCPEGSTCQEGLNGAACTPDCRVRGCAEGQQCKRLDDTDYQCLASVSGECPEKSCAAGERCNMRVSRGRGVFWCAQPCDPVRVDSCPQGEVCGMAGGSLSTCYRQCDPRELDACGADAECVTVSEDMTLWGCRPSVPQ